MKRLTIWLLISVGYCNFVHAQFYKPRDHIYQFSVKVGTRQSYLWIPPKCTYVKGVIIALSNMLERKWLEDPRIRAVAAKQNLGIVWLGPAQKGDQTITADMTPAMKPVFEQMMIDLAAESGYAELATAPVIPMGHSANGHFAWTFANAFPERTIAVIPVKTIPLPEYFQFKNIPVCYIVAQTTEWPQYRVPDPATKPGDRDFYWPVIRDGALALRLKSTDNLIGVVTDPGGGHFDYTENISKFLALYIKKACIFRLPVQGQYPLRPIHNESGWLTGTGGMEPDQHPPAPYKNYKGKAAAAYWFFDKETALAARAFEGDRISRKRQMLTFVQDGKQLNVAKIGYAALSFKPHKDGLTFDVKGDFLSEMPQELIGAGEKLGHAPGQFQFKLITGPAEQTGPSTFKVQFDRYGPAGEIFIQEDHIGNSVYRAATQPGNVRIPIKLTEGTAQLLTFDTIANISQVTKAVAMHASATSGLPVNYYVSSGPAYIQDDKLIITEIPQKARFPVKITVIGYQWGQTILPRFQSTEFISRSFYITR